MEFDTISTRDDHRDGYEIQINKQTKKCMSKGTFHSFQLVDKQSISGCVVSNLLKRYKVDQNTCNIFVSY